MLLLSSVRPSFPSLFWGKERQFEAGNILAVHGEKHKSLRAAWQPMFFSGRRACTSLYPQGWLHGASLPARGGVCAVASVVVRSST